MVQGTRASSRIHEKLPEAESLQDLSVANAARIFRVPYSRWYDALTQLGVKETASFEELLAVLVLLQRSAVTFGALAENLGREVTLGDLADFEAAAFATGAVRPPVARTRTPETEKVEG